MIVRVAVPVFELLDHDLPEFLQLVVTDQRQHQISSGRQTERLRGILESRIRVTVSRASGLSRAHDGHVELNRQTTQLLGNGLDERVGVHTTAQSLDPRRGADVQVVDVDDVGDKLLLQLQLIQQRTEVTAVCLTSRILLDDQLTLRLGSNGRYLVDKCLTG